MSDKIPKKLMREFKQVVGITGAGSAYWQPDLAQVIDLAAQWCNKNRQPFCFGQQYVEPIWEASIGSVTVEHTNLPRAIMTAVVSAAKETKEAGR